VNHDVISPGEFLPQPATLAPASVGLVRFLSRAGLPFPAIPHDADVDIVGELFGKPKKRLGLCSIHNNQFHGLSPHDERPALMTRRWRLPKGKPRTTRADRAYHL
jgi:hypothetical protein